VLAVRIPAGKVIAGATAIAIVGGYLWFAAPTEPAGSADPQLRQARENLEKVRADAAQRTDYTSARKALWSLVTYAELQSGQPEAEVRVTLDELRRSWAEMELRAEREGKTAELEPIRRRLADAFEELPE
jgi:hypothetical protein